MKLWQVQERFSELLDICLREGPRVVTKRALEAAVVPIDDWRRLQQSARPTLKELLLADEPRTEFPLRVRSKLTYKDERVRRHSPTKNGTVRVERK
jgi:antitoxin Phd